jgi:hypothetical protein
MTGADGTALAEIAQNRLQGVFQSRIKQLASTDGLDTFRECSVVGDDRRNSGQRGFEHVQAFGFVVNRGNT